MAQVQIVLTAKNHGMIKLNVEGADRDELKFKQHRYVCGKHKYANPKKPKQPCPL